MNKNNSERISTSISRLYDRNGVMLSVEKITVENGERWIYLLGPAVNGERVLYKHPIAQIGHLLFLSADDVHKSAVELRSKPQYLEYFKAWDSSSAKIKFSKEKVPTSSDYEYKHFDEIEEFLSDQLQLKINQYGNGDKWKAEYFGSRGDTTFLFEKSSLMARMNEPFFARLDCKDENGIYIGKREIKDRVIEWTDERAALYYNYQLYVTNDNIGLSLVRSFDISNKKLHSFNDLYVNETKENSPFHIVANEEPKTSVIADPYLLKIFESTREEKKVHDIIRSIQANQYKIITNNFYKNNLVLGCAGSGKTMILYHRIRYMLRNDRSIKPTDVFVISPSKILTMENRSLVDTLDLDQVHQFSRIEFYQNIISQYFSINKIPENNKYFVLQPAKKNTIPSYLVKDLYSNKFAEHITQQIRNIMSHNTKSEIYRDFCQNKETEYAVGRAQFFPEDFSISEEEIKKLCDSCSRAKSILSNLSPAASIAELNRMHKEMVDLEEEIKKVPAELESNRKRLSNLEVKLDKKREQYDQISSALVVFRRVEKDTKDSIVVEKLEKEAKKLKQECEKKIPNEIEKYENKRINLENQLEEKQAKLSKLQENIPKQEKTIRLLIAQNCFTGSTLRGDFSLIYSFFEIFWNIFKDGTSLTDNVNIASPIQYVEQLSNVFVPYNTYVSFKKEKKSISYFNMIFDYVIQRAKREIGLSESYDYEFEFFILLYSLAHLSGNLGTYSYYFFIDEFQDYSNSELELFEYIFKSSVFNYYGDFGQCINPKGVSSIKELPSRMKNIPIYYIAENYRNAFEITTYANQLCNKEMIPIGIHGQVREDTAITVSNKLLASGNRIALIYCSDTVLSRYGIHKNISRYNFVDSNNPHIIHNKINVLTASQAKGLEFETVFVLLEGMTENEKYVAITRALNELIIIA